MCNCNEILVGIGVAQPTNGTVEFSTVFQVLTPSFQIDVIDSNGIVVATIDETDTGIINLPPDSYTWVLRGLTVKIDCCYGQDCTCGTPQGTLTNSFIVEP